ncbi:MAG TPA: FecR domain-containing protein [Chryseosolibacter sp.]
MSLNESQFRELLDRYLNGTATDEEKKIADEFFASYANEHPGEDAANLLSKKAEIFARIEQRISPQRPHAFYLTTWFKVAATVSLLVLSFWIYNKTIMTIGVNSKLMPVAIQTESTLRGEKAILELPDGTKVHINANSSISYSPSFRDNRTVMLNGEAYFEVVHDPSHPFIVQAKSSSVKVLGTSFNVNATSNEQVAVTLVTGKVNVNSPLQELDIEPGYQAIVNEDHAIEKEKVNVYDYISWKDNVLIFRQTPLDDAVHILEDWYDAKVVISPELRGCTISGEYKNESLENVISSFEFLLKAKAEYKDEKHITLNGKGCNLK